MSNTIWLRNGNSPIKLLFDSNSLGNDLVDIVRVAASFEEQASEVGVHALIASS